MWTPAQSGQTAFQATNTANLPATAHVLSYNVIQVSMVNGQPTMVFNYLIDGSPVSFNAPGSSARTTACPRHGAPPEPALWYQQNQNMSGVPREYPGPGRAKGKSRRKLPDPAACRAQRPGFDGYPFCLVPQPDKCRYAFGFAQAWLCLSPKRGQIVARTGAERRAKGALPSA